MNRLILPLFLALLLTKLTLAGPATAPTTSPVDYVWWEAEKPFFTNFPKVVPFAPQNETERALLSEGAWIGTWAKRTGPISLVYKINVPSDGDWRFYARKFYRHGPYRWRFDEQEWRNVGTDVALLDQVDIRKNICVNWTSVGMVNLSAGQHTLRIEATDNESAIAFDCFILSKKSFVPRGPLKPGASSGNAPPGWFVFEPGPDTPKTEIDLRFLNEDFAGQNGFIQGRDGKMIHEKTGEPVRFWGVNAGPDVCGMDMMDLDDLAAMLARRGVNLVRIHGPVFVTSGADVGKLNPKAIDRIHNAVTAMKKHGIYSTISVYFPLWITLDESNGWPGYRNQHPFAILFWNEQFQQMHRDWWKEVLTRPNPHTGVALKDEPAVLSLEIQNEDSLLFFTFNPYTHIPESQMQSLEQRFAKWCAKRYGTREAAMANWNSRALRGDIPDEGRLGLLDAGSIFSKRDARAQDTAEFLTDLQTDFYNSTRKWMKEELGVKSMISASNWITASPQYLSPLEKISYAGCDLTDHHGYYSGQHDGPRNGYAIDPGDRYADRSFLRLQLSKNGESSKFVNPIFATQINDLPTMISEISWTDPNRFRGEMPLICAGYGALQDVDAIISFALAGPGWQRTMTLWPIQTPTELAQYPAAALIYRRGLVDEGPVIAEIDLQIQAMKKLAGQPVLTTEALDELRQQSVPPGATAEIVGTRLDPRLPMLGRVKTRFNDRPSRTLIGNIGNLIDEEAKTITSATQQIKLDYGKGILQIDSPRAQAATGFFSTQGPIDLSQCTFDSPMEFASIAVVPLDNKPVASSQRLLLQVMTEQKLNGFETNGNELKTIKTMGRAPYLVREIAGTVSLKRPDAAELKVQPIAVNGDAIGPILTGADRIELQRNAIYYFITISK